MPESSGNDHLKHRTRRHINTLDTTSLSSNEREQPKKRTREENVDISPRKKFRRIRGKLNKLIDMPLDILMEVSSIYSQYWQFSYIMVDSFTLTPSRSFASLSQLQKISCISYEPLGFNHGVEKQFCFPWGHTRSPFRYERAYLCVYFAWKSMSCQFFLLFSSLLADSFRIVMLQKGQMCNRVGSMLTSMPEVYRNWYRVRLSIVILNPSLKSSRFLEWNKLQPHLPSDIHMQPWNFSRKISFCLKLGLVGIDWNYSRCILIDYPSREQKGLLRSNPFRLG